MKMFTKLVVFACLVTFAHEGNTGSVSFIKKCKADDYKCQKESAQAAILTFADGIPELGVEKLDPFHYDHLDASAKDLKLLLKDMDITGLKDCQVKKMKRDVPNSKLTLKVLCTVKLDGQYEIGGKLLFLPIEGKGECHAVLRGILIQVDANIVEKEGKDGKTHWDITTFKHSHQLKGKTTLVLENLFEGNEVLGRAANDLLKNSANDVVAEVSPPIIQAIVAKIVKECDKFFRRVPAEELYTA